jgi:hypothetical protein
MKSKAHRPHPRRPSRESRDNRAKQLNRNNDAFWKARGYPERPADWRTLTPPRRNGKPSD